ncbi:hypothetical protein OC25_00415 [Pedobacter kyungheensis]|uniref:Uncharacterized protein n=1 Tax=Pedobacter kyungheensis TaxID=1069985 RepID=A0A0C1DGZ3_9SPHI|nr:hypothetical protein [Pedobacter kyungheensis]KIA96911.1 hypothetical protein OC25_00415 [Pedobacter kyungheensis]
MKHIIYFVLFFFSAQVHGQQLSTIHVILQNADKLNIEKRRFFNQPDYEKTGTPSNSQLAFQLNRGYNLPNFANFKAQKIDEKNYIISIRSDQPEMIYLNYQPVYVEPGDNATVTYSVILKTFDQLIDTVIAEGSKKGNYEFAKYITKASTKIKFPDITANQYKDKVALFYHDLKDYYHTLNAVYDHDPRFKTCSKELIDYLKRRNLEAFFFSLIFSEKKLKAESNMPGVKLLGDSLEKDFRKAQFKASDTLLNFTMENLFKKYFERTVTDKFGNLAHEDNYRAFYDYVKNFENKFVREYFLMLLIANYADKVKKYNPELITNIKNEIANVQILNALRKK